jgi:hypothetical protein
MPKPTWKALVRRAVIRKIQSVRNKVSINLSSEIRRQTASEAAQFVLQHARAAIEFEFRELLWDFSLSKAPREGLVLEFGVFRGYSINYFAKRLPERVLFGFDSFEGLHVDWAGASVLKGYFDQGGRMPAVRSNVRLVKGWFDRTLPPFLSERPGPIALLHVDCDTYDAAKIVLDLVKDRLVPGSVIIFDDYFGYRGWLIGEHRAWAECVAQTGISYEYAAFTNIQMTVVVK